MRRTKQEDTMSKLIQRAARRLVTFGGAWAATNAPGSQGILEDDPRFEYEV